MIARASRCFVLLVIASVSSVCTHEAKDFDDSILYKIEFDMVDFEKNPELHNNLYSFYTHEREKYDCVIPVVEDPKDDKKPDEVEISPLALIRPMFSATICSYRIEVYWSYEICHGHHIRQYHEEREGKNIKFQEYYLGKWSDEKTESLNKILEEQAKSGIKHKTTKIDGIKYPYFEMEMTDGTMCDIIGEPRTTKIRYVCYPHGKNDIYSFKETSSCNYEAVILTSLLCIDPAFHPEESKEVAIKCFNSGASELHKPLSMLRQELSELMMSDIDLPVPKDGSTSTVATGLSGTNDRYIFVNKVGNDIIVDVDKIVQDLIDGADSKHSGVVRPADHDLKATSPAPIRDYKPIKEFLSGKTCITGGTGWWKFEFCHRVHVRQFHVDGKGEQEIFLGYFNEPAHRQWIQSNPEKAFKQQRSTSIWHHYEGGSRCDRTGKPREVDVKLACASVNSSPTSGAMYLLEPKTCQYILVVESPIICDLMKISDEYGLVDNDKLQELIDAKDNLDKKAVSEDNTSRSSEKEEGNAESNENKIDPSDGSVELPAKKLN